jgi:hypothetical protein
MVGAFALILGGSVLATRGGGGDKAALAEPDPAAAAAETNTVAGAQAQRPDEVVGA